MGAPTVDAGSPRPVRVLCLLANDRAKADTVSLTRWVGALDRRRVALTVAFLSPASGQVGLLGEFADAQGRPLTVPQALERAGVRVEHWPSGRWLSPAALRQAADLVRGQAVRIVQSLYLRADVFSALLMRRLGRIGPPRPLWLVRAAGIGPYRRVRLYAGRSGWLDRRVYRRADHFVAVSGAVAVDWSQRLGRAEHDVTVIHNGVPSPPAGPIDRDRIRRDLGVAADETLAVTVGRLDREKGLEALIETAARMRAVRPRLRWAIVGEGPLRAALRGQIDRQGLAGRVILAGPRADVWALLRSADLFVLPSRMEACPNALLEAASAGLPIVATAVGGVPELLTDGQHALLVDASRGAEGLAEAIGRLLDQPVLRARLAEAATDRVAVDFSPQAVAERYAGLYERLAGR